jgi:hypothetical protein
MPETQNATSNGTSPTVAEESDEQTTSDVKLYRVPVTAHLYMTMTVYVDVYALNDATAFDKVQNQIDTLDQLEIEDCESGRMIPDNPYTAVNNLDFDIEIDSEIDVIEDDVYAAEVLRADDDHFKTQICWSAEVLTKHRAFLESLKKESHDKQVVAA